MSPRTRRSARLAGAASKGKRAPELPAVAESNGPQPRDELQQLRDVSPPSRSAPSMPKSSIVKPPHEKMHPSKVHQSTGEPSSALRLGFFDMPSEADVRRGCPPKTPSKVTGIPSSFTFSAPRDTAESVLSGEAQLLMHHLHEAAKHKAELIASRDADAGTTQTDGRVIAKPTGRAGRFSAAHMAEFKKMDSIEGHASAWRAQGGRFTPMKSALKCSPSKANLDGTATSVGEDNLNGSVTTRTHFEGTPNPRLKSGLKRTPSVANLDSRPTSKGSDGVSLANKSPAVSRSTPHYSNTKRFKQAPGDDTSHAVSVAIKAEIKGKSSFESASDRAPATARSVAPSGSNTLRKPTISMVPSSKKLVGFAKSMLTTIDGGPNKVAAGLMKALGEPNTSQGALSSRNQDQGLDGMKSNLPKPTTALSRTPAPKCNRTALPRASFTTPRRKLVKRVAFTPETKREALLQDSPSPKKVEAGKPRAPLQAITVHEHSGQGAGATKPEADGSLYPDLSPLKRLVPSSPEAGQPQSSTVPGAFTFRSDRNIEFGECVSTGFGSSPGQASVRHVQASSTSKVMPGSFPAPPPPSTHSDKENTAPAPAPTGMLPGTAHGMPNKKRHRAASDEEDTEAEAAKRAMKRRRNEEVAEGQALFAPRVVNSHPHGTLRKDTIRTPGKSFKRSPSKTPFRATARTPIAALPSVSPSKKGATLSMRRLQMLAQPKRRT